jgi:hypothetical protein
MAGRIPVMNTIGLKVTLSSQIATPPTDLPATINLSLYDPSNVLVYSDNNPIPIQNLSTYFWEFWIPANALLVQTFDEANYTALVRVNMESGRIQSNTIKIKTD